MKKSGCAHVAAEGGGTVTAVPVRGDATPEQDAADSRRASCDGVATVLFLTDWSGAYDHVDDGDPIVVRDHLRGRTRRRFDYTGFCSVAVRTSLDVVSVAVERRALPSRRGVNQQMPRTTRRSTTPALGGHVRPRLALVRGAR
ncbi:hypothetical protein C8E05_5107 [Rhodococcus wratislaviensis]|nr:hypothetical protein [Rhodococcus wratislaviensis]REE75639.1 hypothetical protein C8E05_5107 [Rhodococcus wratislaviensis]SPZ39324.1 Uncharacterised protein [Rhodococcus wratislaviensis]